MTRLGDEDNYEATPRLVRSPQPYNGVYSCPNGLHPYLPRVGIIPDPLLMSTKAGKALATEVQYRYSQ